MCVGRGISPAPERDEAREQNSSWGPPEPLLWSIRVPPPRAPLSTSLHKTWAWAAWRSTSLKWTGLFSPLFPTKWNSLEEALLFSLENQRPSLYREARLSYDLFIVVIKKCPFSFCKLFCFLIEYDLFSRYWHIRSFIYALTHLSRWSWQVMYYPTVNYLFLKSNRCFLMSQ